MQVPFFMDKENASGIVSNKDVIISRENPRDWVHPTAREFPMGSDSCILSQLKHTSADGKLSFLMYYLSISCLPFTSFIKCIYRS